MMPPNTGHPPPFEKVDLMFRNKTIARGVDPTKYRWRNDDPRFPQLSAGDIVSWQHSKGEK